MLILVNPWRNFDPNYYETHSPGYGRGKYDYPGRGYGSQRSHRRGQSSYRGQMNYGGQTNYRGYNQRDQTSFQQKEKKSIELDIEEPISGKKIIFVIGFFLISFKCINYYLRLEQYLEGRYQE